MQPPRNTKPRVLSRTVLAVLIAGSVGVSFFLIPSQREMLERLQRDQLCDAIAPILKDHWTDEKRTPAELLESLPIERLKLLGRLAALTPREQLRQIFGLARPLTYDPFVHHFALGAVRFVDVIPPAEAWSIIEPVTGQIPDQPRLQLLRLLATNALAVGNPALAAQVSARACESGISKWEDARQMVLGFRWSGQPGMAVRHLRAWQQRRKHPSSPAEEAEIREVGYRLALEANLPGEAFDLCLHQLNAQPALSPASAVLLEQAYHAAVLAERSREMLPWIESFIATLPEARLAWKDLLRMDGDATSSRATYKTWVKRAAEVADWHALPEKAYSHYLRLVAMREIASLDRFLPLSDALGRGEETAEVLQALGPLPNREQLEIYVARLVASNGEAGKARGMYEAWVAEHPEDRSARFELACLLEGIADIQTAMRSFEEFLRAFPRDVAAIKKLARLRVRAGQYETALRDLAALQDGDFDPITLEDFTMLAESLDRDEMLLRALQIQSRRPGFASPDLYVRMSEIARRSPDEEAPLRVLREGITRMPDRPSLRVELATLLIEREQFDEALTEALHPRLRTRYEGKCLALAAAIHTSRAAEALEAVGPRFEHESRLPLQTRLDLAVACLQARQTQRGEALLAAVPASPENYARLGEARLLAGQFAEAERLARLNLDRTAAPSASDWMLLGDAQSLQGREAEANEAYARALSVITNRISNEAAPPRPVAGVGNASSFR